MNTLVVNPNQIYNSSKLRSEKLPVNEASFLKRIQTQELTAKHPQLLMLGALKEQLLDSKKVQQMEQVLGA